MAGFTRRPDAWSKLACQPYGNSVEARALAADYKLDGLTVHRIYDKENKGDVRIAFVYESEEEDCAKIVARCAQRALLNHSTKTLEAIYAIKIPDCKDYFAVTCDYLYAIDPDVVIVVSRDVMLKLNPPKKYDGVDVLQLINRLHTLRWDDLDYPTVVTLPDNDVLARTEDGKVAKEAATRLGEWVDAITVALRQRNLYTISLAKYTYDIIDTLDKFEQFMDLLYDAPVVSIDTETDNLNRIVNKLGTIQFAFDAHKAWVLPFFHPESPFSEKELKYIASELREYFERAKPVLHIYANAKFDLIQVVRDLKLRWVNHDCWDIQRGEYLKNENRKFRIVKLIRAVTGKDRLSAYALAQLALEYGCTAYLTSNMGKDDRANIFGTPLKHVSEYGGLDVCIPFQIYKFQKKEFESRGPAYRRSPTVLTKQINSMIRAFVEMELTGLPVDKAYLVKEVASEGAFVKARKQAREEIYATEAVRKANSILLKNTVGPDLFGRNDVDNWVFDIDKVEHQCLLFFDVLELEPVKIGKSGNPSVDKAFKEKYAPLDDSGKLLEDIAVPEVAMFRDYSELKHLYNSFLKGFLNKFYENPDMRKDGRLRPSFKDLDIVTGRAGAEKPSLQQVPSRSKLAKAIKRQFIALEGQLFVKADFIAHEVKNWAIASREMKLADTFIKTLQKRKQFRLLKVVDDPKVWEDEFKMLDLHRINCGLFFGVAPKDVTKQMRGKVKTLVFGTVYGMSAIRLAITLKISEEEAQELIDILFDRFPDGTLYITSTHEFGAKYLTVSSGIGRVRHLWGYLHTNFGVYGAMDRRGVNSRIQSVASDEGFEGNFQTQKLRWNLFWSQALPLRFRLSNAVHDSLESLSNIETVPVAAYLIEHGFTTCVHRSYLENYGMDFSEVCALEMDFECGPNLGDMQEWNYRPEELRRIVYESVKWQRDNLNHKVGKDTLRKFEDNLDMIHELRCGELRKMPANGVNMHIALTRKLAKEVAF
jgi:DNA polymerase I-like protein with 3'-5' exonuclease and polymerase domains